MRPITIIAVILFIRSSLFTDLYAQEIKPVDFVDYNPDWIHYPWIDTLSPYFQDFELVDAPVVEDDYVIFVYNIIGFIKYGYLIEKLNLNTGEVMWSTHDFSLEQYTRKVVVDFTIDADTLRIFLLEEAESIYNRTYPPWDSGFVAESKILISSGEEISYQGTDHFDPLNTPIKKDFFTFNNLLISEDLNGYNKISSNFGRVDDTTQVHNFISEKLNHDGTLISSDTIKLLIPIVSTIVRDNYVVDSTINIALIADSGSNFPNSSPIAFLCFYDNSLSIFDTMHIEHILNEIPWEVALLSNISRDRFIVSTGSRTETDSTVFLQSILFDYEGNIVEKFNTSFTYDNRRPLLYGGNFTDDDKFLGVGWYANVNTDSTSNVFVWKSDGENEKLDTLIDIKTSFTDIQLFPNNIISTSNDDVLIACRQRQPSFPPSVPNPPINIAPDWRFWMKINAVDLGLLSSVTIENKEKKAILFPNPTNGDVNVLDSKVKRIEVINNTGQVVYRCKLSDGRFNIHHLYNGNFWVKLIYENSITVLPIIKQ